MSVLSSRYRFRCRGCGSANPVAVTTTGLGALGCDNHGVCRELLAGRRPAQRCEIPGIPRCHFGAVLIRVPLAGRTGACHVRTWPQPLIRAYGATPRTLPIPLPVSCAPLSITPLRTAGTPQPSAGAMNSEPMQGWSYRASALRGVEPDGVHVGRLQDTGHPVVLTRVPPWPDERVHIAGARRAAAGDAWDIVAGVGEQPDAFECVGGIFLVLRGIREGPDLDECLRHESLGRAFPLAAVPPARSRRVCCGGRGAVHLGLARGRRAWFWSHRSVLSLRGMVSFPRGGEQRPACDQGRRGRGR
jgi:hypothetical protein